jgi:hypothetical protein
MSPSRNDYSAFVRMQGYPSETVKGIGMGMDTPSGFNAGIHTSTLVVFQRVDKMEMPTIVKDLATPIQLLAPVNGPITQGFGPSDIDYGSLKGHTGIDYGVAEGTEVRATDSGQVVEQGYLATTYGNYVKLRHVWGESVYGHLSQASVMQGDHVAKGQVVGRSGSTGKATGPHLHFAIRVYPYDRSDGWDGYSDPMPYLKKSAPQPVKSILPKVINDVLRQVAKESGLEEELLQSLAWAESSYRPEIKDGLFQVGDGAWQDFAAGVGATNRNNALDNARVAAAYLKYLLARYDQNIWKALYAYNWGMSRVDSGDEPPFLTQIYAHKVVHGRDLLKVAGD